MGVLENKESFAASPVSIIWTDGKKSAMNHQRMSTPSSAQKTAAMYTSKSRDNSAAASSKKVCLCAPTTHPGSFKCRHHRATVSTHKLSSAVEVDNLSQSLSSVNIISKKTPPPSRLGRPAATAAATSVHK